MRIAREEVCRGTGVDSVLNMADPLTKPLSQQKTEAHLEKMGLRYMANWL